MGTDATYKFKNNAFTAVDITFYIHGYGYPSGAVKYLKAMLEQNGNHNQGLAGEFCRANDRAEFTTDHGDQMNDTEYRYIITPYGDVTALSRNDYSEDGFQAFFSGPIEDFIQEYGD